jgi:lipopolysaccharide transport system ATP-binding protein
LGATGQGRTETGRQGAGETRSKAGFLLVTPSPPLLVSISRITEPTEGYAEIHGRVGSLLEVGTGFHPTPLCPPASRGKAGRENIYLNGAIPSTMLRASLGMKRAEIDRKFDEIVAFAEVEKFMDTPVKRYSSGMYVRLAFAVAAQM